ncbi:MAG: tetratricopeptide repeat protein [Phycisphaerales bacterium]|nr:tetratricopeptide repeat protein [Phycisphaerales bacterium]
MKSNRRTGRINVALILALVIGVAALGFGAVMLRSWRGERLANSALADAEAAAGAGDFDKAAKQYQEYLGRHPQDVAVLEKWASANLLARPRQAKHLSKAVQAYRELLRLNPGEEKYLKPLVRLQARAYDAPDQLLYWANIWHEAHPESAQAALWLGRARTAMGQFEDARKTLGALAAGPSSSPDAFILLALLEVDAQPGAEGLKAARARYDEGVTRFPDSAKLSAYLGRFLLRNVRDLAAARAELERAETLKVETPALHMRLFDEWTDLGEVARAEAHLKAAKDASPQARAASIAEEVVVDIGEEPESWQIFVFRADARLVRLKIAKKLEPPSTAGALASEWEDALTPLQGRELEYLPSLIELYGLAGRGAEAKKNADAYRAAIDPASPRADVQRAWATVYDAIAILAMNAPDSAHRVIALPDEVRAPRIFLYKALCYRKIGQLTPARRSIERYIEAEPDDPEGLWHLTQILVDAGDWASVLKEASRLAQFEPYRDDAAWAQVRAEIALLPMDPAQVKAERADALRGQLAKVRPELPADRLQARLWLAMLESKAGQFESAEKLLRAPLGEGMDPKDATDALVAFLLGRGRDDEAAQAALQSAEAHPDDARLWLALADLYERLGKTEEAKQAVEKTAALADGDPTTRADSLLARATFQLKHGDVEAGLKQLEELRASTPTNPRCRVLLLEARLDADEALAPFDATHVQKLIDELKNIESPAEGIRWRFYQARAWLRGDPNHDEKEITTLLTECLQRDPAFASAAEALGLFHEEKGRAAQAEDVYRRVLAANPRAVRVAERLLSLLQQQARFAEATQVADLLSAAGRDVTSSRVDIALREDRPQDAVALLRSHIAEKPKDGGARFLLAQLLSRGGAPYDGVKKLLDEAEALLPNSSAILLARTEMLEREQRFAEAEALCNREVESKHSYAAHLVRGRFYFRRDRLEEAERDFKRLPELPENPAEGWFLLGRFYAESGRPTEAIRTMEAGLASVPDALPLKQGLAELLLSSTLPQDRARGRQMLDQFLAQHPGDPLLQLLSAALLHEKRDKASVEQAEGMLQQILEARPTLLQAHLLHIQIARERGEEDAAMNLCREALLLLPRNSSLRIVQADIERRRGNLAQARDILEDVLAREPAQAQARMLLADVARAEGASAGPDSALALIDEAIKSDPHSDAAHVKRALTLQEAGRSKEAVEGLTAYADSRGESASPALLAALADLHVVAGETDAAQRWLDRALAKAPQSPDVLLVSLRLSAKRGRFDEVSKTLEKCRADKLGDARVYTTGANLLAATGNPAHLAAARDVLIPVTRDDETNHEAWLALASVQYLLGDRAAALAAYEKVANARTSGRRNLVIALNGVAWLLYEENRDPKRALELADRAVSLASGADGSNPRSPVLIDVLDTRGHILERMNEPKRAGADYQQCAAAAQRAGHRAEQAKALVQLGRVLLASGDAAQAKSRLDEAQAMHASAACLDEATLKELEALLGKVGR